MSANQAQRPDAPGAPPDQDAAVAATGPRPAYWSRAGLLLGARAMLPMLPGQFAFGMAFGAFAAQRGFTLVEAVAINGIVYAGMSQFVAIQSWPEVITPATIAALMLLTATVNLRFFLMSATMRPWLGNLPAWQVYPPLAINTDGGWLLSMRYRDAGGADASFWLGGHILSYFCWTLSAIPGYLLAERIANPKTFGIDLIMPAFFAALLIPAYRSARRAVPWAIAGIVAVAVNWFMPGYWFLIAGALAGSISAGLIPDEADANGQ